MEKNCTGRTEEHQWRHRRDNDADHHVTRVRQENERGNKPPHVVAAVRHATGSPLPCACVRASIRFQIDARSVHAALPSAPDRRAWITLVREREITALPPIELDGSSGEDEDQTRDEETETYRRDQDQAPRHHVASRLHNLIDRHSAIVVVQFRDVV